MAKIKYTKSELKGQRDALRRFERFLPTLELKKQQLQLEARRVAAALEQNRAEDARLRAEIEAWMRLFAEPLPFHDWLRVREVRQAGGNIAGVAIPVLQEVVFERRLPDLQATPAWLDDGLEALERLARLRLARAVLETQARLLGEELRVTTQRVNLFENVKIPESREHIRVIRIVLGDQQTAAVARAKIAKRKAVAAVPA